MGSPVSPTVAKIYMEHFESKALQTSLHPPRVWLCYVDDTFTVLKEEYKAEFTDHLNNQDRYIKFTSESEDNGSIPMLDVRVIQKEDNSVKLQVYRKPTHTDQYLNFRSNHTLAVKYGVIKTLHHRAETVTSNKQDLKQEKEHLKSALFNNGYTDWSIQMGATKIKERTKPRIRSQQGDTKIKLSHFHPLCSRH